MPFPARGSKNAPASALAKSRIKQVERCHQRAAICPVPAASALPGWPHKLLSTLGNPLGNGVTVAQQTLTLFVLVRIQVPQPSKINHLAQIFDIKSSQKFQLGRPWEASDRCVSSPALAPVSFPLFFVIPLNETQGERDETNRPLL
jgi:hypothetical protein